MSDSLRFEEIMCEIKELLDEAIYLVPPHARSRAESYWYSHMLTSVDSDNGYMGQSMCSMEDSLEAIKDAEDEEDEE